MVVDPTGTDDAPTGTDYALTGMDVDAPTRMKGIVLSFQGAFGPPTFGHYMAMVNFAEAMIEYAGANNMTGFPIVMLFMPTAASGSKLHLGKTQKSRLYALNLFCKILSTAFSRYPNISFIASDIEYELYGIEPDSGTYRTIDQLKKTYENHLIFLGMGLDNAYQLPYWKKIDTYRDNLAGIFVVPRVLTTAEQERTRQFSIGDSETKLFFDMIVPWKIEGKAYPVVAEGFNLDPEGVSLDKNFDLRPYFPNGGHYNLPLPEIKIVTYYPVPNTSSTHLRQLICSFINSPGSRTRSDGLRDEIIRYMFGGMVDPDVEGVFNDTIKDYQAKKLCQPPPPPPPTAVGGKRTKKRKQRKTKKNKKKNKKTNKRSN